MGNQETNKDQKDASQGIFLIGEKTQPKANSLPTQGSLRQLLRTFLDFRRYDAINGGLLFSSIFIIPQTPLLV